MNYLVQVSDQNWVSYLTQFWQRMENALYDFQNLTYSNWKATWHVSDDSEVLAMPC